MRENVKDLELVNTRTEHLGESINCTEKSDIIGQDDVIPSRNESKLETTKNSVNQSLATPISIEQGDIKITSKKLKKGTKV